MAERSEHTDYESDQGLNLARLPLLLVGPILVALGVAWLMWVWFASDWYFAVLVPLLAAFSMGGFMHLFVGWSHCRNRWLAAVVGLLVGCVTYFGFYYFRMSDQLAPGKAASIAKLPEYIVFCMQTQMIKGMRGQQQVGQPVRPFVLGNWFAFAFELGFMAVVPAGAAWRRARFAYCGALRQWMRREMAMLPPFCGPAVREFFQAGDLERFVDAYVVRGPDGLVEATNSPTIKTTQTACRLILEYAAPQDNAVLSYPVFVSIDDRPRPKPWYMHKNARRTMLRQLTLRTQDVLTVSPLFPKLSGMLAAGYRELEHLPTGSEPLTLAGTSDVAEITPVPEPYCNRVRSRGYVLKVNLLGLLPIVFMLGGVGLLVWGFGGANAMSNVLAVVLCALGAAGVAWGLYTSRYCPGAFENRWIERRLRREVAHRPDVIASPHDPEVMYVSIVPREHWTKVKLVMSTDLLLLGIDDVEGAVLLEGDTNRYRIPSGAIADCQPECFFHPVDRQRKNQLWMVRLAILTRDGMRELLLSANDATFRPHTNRSRRAAAEDLCERINALTEPLIEA